RGLSHVTCVHTAVRLHIYRMVHSQILLSFASIFESSETCSVVAPTQRNDPSRIIQPSVVTLRKCLTQGDTFSELNRAQSLRIHFEMQLALATADHCHHRAIDTLRHESALALAHADTVQHSGQFCCALILANIRCHTQL